jgi:hypothetical protein
MQKRLPAVARNRATAKGKGKKRQSIGSINKRKKFNFCTVRIGGARASFVSPFTHLPPKLKA